MICIFKGSMFVPYNSLHKGCLGLTCLCEITTAVIFKKMKADTCSMKNVLG